MGFSRQLVTASTVTFLARFLTFGNRKETDGDNDNNEEVRGLAIVPTMLVVAGWSLFTWIGMAHKDDLVSHPDDLEEDE